MGAAHVVSGAAARAQAVAGTSNVPPGNAPKTAKAKTTATVAAAATPAATKEPENGYWEMVGGLGLSQIKVGNSLIGVTAFETDLIRQNNENLHWLLAHVGVGFVYYLASTDAYFCKITWFPSIEPILNLSYYDLHAEGPVYRFNNRNLDASLSFDMPIRTTTLMLDILLNVISVYHFSLFVLGGAGAAWSHINYTDSPYTNNPFARPGLDLETRMQSNYVYEWGAGLSYMFTPHFKMALEYLYTHVGNFKTSGRGTLDGLRDPVVYPATFSLRTQAVILDAYATFC